MVKNPPANAGTKETQVQSLGQEDPLEEGMATHSNILAWRISWTEEPGGLQSIGLQRDTQLSRHALRINPTNSADSAKDRQMKSGHVINELEEDVCQMLAHSTSTWLTNPRSENLSG